ncbi:type IV pilus biogenesis protein PilP [Xanthomonas campestris pv. campestris]|uniref:type IV pilus biogenesis protein PilP n=1 Tax=Xanthomonas campestris TaxID=339 RepID=UPI001E4DF8D7|nr:type IV pilus biogenesis protein PilP [Xanthomonas campestris]MCD0253114.1 type IV pilus biogenesis protein PilP [Xanthomonas campestris pv. campestris]
MMLLQSGVTLAQSSVADIDKIQAETLRLRAQASQAKAAKELADIRGETLSTASMDAGGGLPVASGVFGANGKRYVEFIYPTGATAEAAEGGKIPGDYQVKSFDSSGVVLVKGKRTYRVPFAAQAPTPPPVAATPAAGQPFGPPAFGPVSPVPPIR